MSVHRGIHSEISGVLVTQQGKFTEPVGVLWNEEGRGVVGLYRPWVCRVVFYPKAEQEVVGGQEGISC